MLRAESRGHNSLRSDKCPLLSALSILPRAKRNQIPVFMHSCPEALRLAGARSAPLLRSARKRAEKFGCYVRLRGLVDEEGDFMADVFDAV